MTIDAPGDAGNDTPTRDLRALEKYIAAMPAGRYVPASWSSEAPVVVIARGYANEGVTGEMITEAYPPVDGGNAQYVYCLPPLLAHILAWYADEWNYHIIERVDGLPAGREQRFAAAVAGLLMLHGRHYDEEIGYELNQWLTDRSYYGWEDELDAILDALASVADKIVPATALAATLCALMGDGLPLNEAYETALAVTTEGDVR